MSAESLDRQRTSGVDGVPESAWRQSIAESIPNMPCCRSIVNVSDDDAEVVVINGGDDRTRLEWAPDVVEAAKATGVGRDANGYLAPWELIQFSVPAAWCARIQSGGSSPTANG